MSGAVVFLMLAGFLATGTPIAVAMIATVIVSLLLFTQVPMLVIIQQMFNSADSFTLMAIPFFVLSGTIMTAGGISRRLIRVATALFGGLPGGVGNRRHRCLRLFCRHIRLISGNRGRHRRRDDPGPAEGRL